MMGVQVICQARANPRPIGSSTLPAHVPSYAGVGSKTSSTGAEDVSTSILPKSKTVSPIALK